MLVLSLNCIGRKSMPRYLWSILFGLFLTVSLYPAFDDFSTKRALFIASYHPDFPSFPKQVKGLKEVFDAHSVKLDIEFMDSKRFNNEENLKRFESLMSYKLSQVPQYDVVLVADDNALHFWKERQETLLKGTPIIFFAVNNVKFALEQNKNDHITGVVEALSIAETVQMAGELFPNRKRIYAITDQSKTGQAQLAMFNAISDEQSSLKRQKLSLADLSFEELYKKLEDLGEGDLVLLLVAYRDRNGQVLNIDKTVEAIVRSSKAPVFCTQEHSLKEGVLGGEVISHYEQGKAAAEMAISYFRGRDFNLIEVLEKSPNVKFFDYPSLKSFGLSEADLPEESVVLNKPSSFLYQNRYLIGFWAFGSFSLLVITVTLLYLNRKVHKSEVEMQEALRLNEELVSSSPIAIAIYTSDGSVQSCNEPFTQILSFDQFESSEEGDKKGVMFALLKEAQNLETKIRREIPLLCDGVKIFLDCQVMPIRFKDDSYFVFTASDITEVKGMNAELEKRVNARTQELRKLNSELELAHANAERVGQAQNRFLSLMKHCVERSDEGELEGLYSLMMESLDLGDMEKFYTELERIEDKLNL